MFKIIIKMLKWVFSPTKKSKPIEKSEREKMSLAYHILIIGGLTLLLFGMSYGGLYGAFFLDKYHSEQNNYFKTAIDYAAAGKVAEAKKAYDKSDETQFLMEALVSGHTHLTLFGLIALALSINVNKIKIKEKWKTAAALAILIGGLLLPTGVVVQPLLNKTLGKIISTIGGLSIMGSIIVYGWAIIRPKLLHANWRK